MSRRLQSLYNLATFFAHIIRNRTQHGFYNGMAYEPVYRDLFIREVCRAGLEDIYFPVGGAANHSLLYLIIRIMRECPIWRVVEFGCGQTTILIDQLREKIGKPEEIVSLENNRYWADKIAGVTRCRVIRADLVRMRLNGIECLTYDLTDLDKGEGIDLFIVDGPEGSSRNSRFGALEVIETRLSQEFIVIFDDAERIGEIDTIRACRSILKRKEKKFYEKVFSAGNQQHVFYTELFRKVAEF